MFGREDDNLSPGGGNANSSILGEGGEFKGSIKVKGPLRIEGNFEGEVDCADTLEVGKSGTIKGNLSVKDAVISGKVNGNIHAKQRLELQGGSHVEGDIVTRRLVIDEGVYFEGNCRMGERQDNPKSKPQAQPRPELSEKPESGSELPLR